MWMSQNKREQKGERGKEKRKGRETEKMTEERDKGRRTDKSLIPLQIS